MVRAGGLEDDEACKLFRALRVTAVRFGLELASQSKASRGVTEATDARTALRTEEAMGRNGREVGAGVPHEERC